MAETLYKTYEGMFLVDPGTTDFNAASEMINAILGKRNAEIVSIKPWDDRRLAYDIKGRSRGLYVLVYFKLDPAMITSIERDCQLNEGILRVLITRRDKLTEQEIAAETPATSTPQKVDEDSDQPAGTGTEDAPAETSDDGIIEGSQDEEIQPAE